MKNKLKDKPLTKKEVKDVILKFCDLNAGRAPISAFAPIIDVEKFELKLLGTDIAFYGIGGFADHQMGKLVYFDQRFILKSMKTTIKSDYAIAVTSFIWEARHWEPPAAFSELLRAYVRQSWKIVRSSKTQSAMIVSHIADKFKYLKGYSPGDKRPEDFHLTLGRKKRRKS